MRSHSFSETAGASNKCLLRHAEGYSGHTLSPRRRGPISRFLPPAIMVVERILEYKPGAQSRHSTEGTAVLLSDRNRKGAGIQTWRTVSTLNRKNVGTTYLYCGVYKMSSVSMTG